MMTYSHRMNPYLRTYFAEDVNTEQPQQNSQQPQQPQQATEKQPGFFQSAMQGFKQQYQAQKNFSPEEIKNYEAMAEKIKPSIEKAQEITHHIDHWLHKHAVAKQVAIACIAAGLTGGAGAIPLAAINYAIIKFASKAVDKAFDAGQKVAGQVAQFSAQQQFQPEHLSFEAYFQQRMLLDESLWSDAGKIMGQTAGYVAGKAAKWSGAAINMFKTLLTGLKNQASSILKFASENKLVVAKAAILTGISILVGAGVGSAYKALTDQSLGVPLVKAILDVKLATAAELTELVGSEMISAVKHLPQELQHLTHAAHASGEFASNLGKSGGAHAGAWAGTGALSGVALGH